MSLLHGCPEAIQHSPPTSAGKCSFCGQKIDGPIPRPKRWRNYGKAIDSLGRHDGTDPSVDEPEYDD